MPLEPTTRIVSSRNGSAVPSAEAIRNQMERILADPLFEASPRRRNLFRFLVEETLAGRGDHLKGYNIALAIFNRDETFDSQSDPIVRIEARRLRSDLDGYYAGPGHRDDLRIAIPKGGYVPLAYWQARPDAPEQPQPSTESLVEAQTVTAPKIEDRARDDRTNRSSSRISSAILAALAIALVAVGVWASRSTGLEATKEVASVQGVPVIVLPFTASDASSTNELIAQGLTQELISELMQFSGLKLFTANASFRQSANADPAVLSKDLGVLYVVQGNVATEEDGLHVVADLVEAKTGEVLWSKSYNRKLNPGEILAVRLAVAGEIATILGQSYGTIKADVTNRGSLRSKPEMTSYLCLLQAQNYRRTFDAALHGTTLKCLQEAVKQDPAYADAWAMLGWLQMDEVRFNLVTAAEAGQTMDAAFKSASRAVEMDPENVLGLQALSAINYYSGRIEESERLMRVVLSLNPNDPDSLAQFGWRLAARGKFDEGIPLVERAIARTMRPPGWYYHSIAVHQYLQGNYAAAIDAAQRSAVNGSAIGWSIIAAAQASLGNEAEARAALTNMGKADPDMMKDPVAVFRTHQVIESTIDALSAGLKRAGWKDS